MPPNTRSFARRWRCRSGLARSRRLESAPMQREFGARVIRFAQLLCRRFATCLGGRGGACVCGWTARSAPIITCAAPASGATITRMLTATLRPTRPITSSSTVTSHGVDVAAHHHGSAPLSGLGCRCKLLLLRLLRSHRAALSERAGSAVRVDAEHRLRPTAAMSDGIVPEGLRRPPRPLSDRLTARSSTAATRIAASWGCRCSISDSIIEPLVAHVSASGRGGGRRRRVADAAVRSADGA